MLHQLRRWLRRLWPLASEEERAIRRELLFHLDRLTEQFRAQGMSRRQARRAALRRFGQVGHIEQELATVNGIREVQYKGDGTMKGLINDLGQDVRFGLRTLRKSPGFTTVAVLTLALGIGANTAIFSAVNGILLHPFPYKDPDRIVTIWQRNLEQGAERVSPQVSSGDFLDWQERSQSFAAMSLLRPYGFDFHGGQEPEDIGAWLVTKGFFQVFGVNPMLGRSFTPEEYADDSQNVAVFTYSLWQRLFGGDPDLIGKSVELQGQMFIVLGIMPPGFRAPDGMEILAPRAFSERMRRDRTSAYHKAVARLKPGVTLERAQTEMEMISAQLEHDYPETNAGVTVSLITLPEMIVGPVRPLLLMLLASVAAVLLIACANVANLLLARGVDRNREFALRAALGAPRSRLVRQLLAESLLLALLGGALGIWVAYAGVQTFLALIPQSTPRLEYVGMDVSVLGFALGISGLTALLFGLTPAIQLTKADLQASLKEGGQAAGKGSGHSGVRNALVVAEVALAFVLLVGAGLLLRSFASLMSVELGFASEKLLALQVFAYGPKYSTGQEQVQFFEQTIENIAAQPGVTSAAAASFLPFLEAHIGMESPMEILGRSQQDLPGVYVTVASSGYFRTMGIPLLEGRSFTRQDRAGGHAVAIVNKSLADRHWAGRSPVGAKIRLPDYHDQQIEELEIVGVVGDVRQGGLRGSAVPEVILPLDQNPFGSMTLVVRTSIDAAPILQSAKAAVWEIDPKMAFYDDGVMDTLIVTSVADSRFQAYLLGGFAGLALSLAAAGIYGVISLLARQRTREIGIRIALGAGRVDILRLVVGKGLGLASAGLAIGLAGAYLLTRFLERFLFGIAPTDPITIAGVSLLLLLVAVVACWVPARRAAKVDPMVALRYE